MAYQQGPPGSGYPPAQVMYQQPTGYYPPQPAAADHHTTIIIQQQPKIVTQPVVKSVSNYVDEATR